MTMKIVTAHKEHTCTLCGKKIPKGDRYWKEADLVEALNKAIENGGREPYKEHTNCELYSN